MTIKMVSAEDNGSFHSEESRINVLVQQMLVSRVFAATYTGRLYVPSIKAYRDVLQIYKEERDFINDLDIVRNRITNFFQGAMWAAISGPESKDLTTGHCIWVRLENIPFGAYWFMIESVNIYDGGEVVFKIKVIRNFVPDDKTRTNQETPVNWNEIKDDIFKVVKGTITWHNTKESVKFLFLLTMTLVTTFLYALQYVGEYSLKFFREFNNFVKVCTPVFLGILDLISKTIGGFYILLAMLWRGRSSPPPEVYQRLQTPPNRQFRSIKPANYYQRRPNYDQSKLSY